MAGSSTMGWPCPWPGAALAAPSRGRITISVEPRFTASPTASSIVLPCSGWGSRSLVVGPALRSRRRRVPFALPRSSIAMGGPRWMIACRRETELSSIGTSFSGDRPSDTRPSAGSGCRVTRPPANTASSRAPCTSFRVGFAEATFLSCSLRLVLPRRAAPVCSRLEPRAPAGAPSWSPRTAGARTAGGRAPEEPRCVAGDEAGMVLVAP